MKQSSANSFDSRTFVQHESGLCRLVKPTRIFKTEKKLKSSSLYTTNPNYCLFANFLLLKIRKKSKKKFSIQKQFQSLPQRICSLYRKIPFRFVVKHYARLTFSSINLLASYESGGDNKITSYWKNDEPSQLRHFRYFEWHEADIHAAVYEKYFSSSQLLQQAIVLKKFH